MEVRHHEAAWRLPESNPYAALECGTTSTSPRVAQRGPFDSLFLADSPQLFGAVLRARSEVA
jgi:hypothetical protein